MSMKSPYDQRPRGLVILTHLFRLFRRWFSKLRSLKAETTDLYASAMGHPYNALFRLIFPRFFAKVQYELTHEKELIEAAQDGVVVYIGKSVGQLEYHYYAHLLKKLGLPLAAFATDISSRRWMSWRRMLDTLLLQCQTLESKGFLPDPMASGYLESLLSRGNSLLISLSAAELEDESLFLSEAEGPLLTLIRTSRRRERPIFLLPLEFIWDRRPAKPSKSIIDLIFGEKENPGRLRKLILFWRHYKSRALVRVGSPLSLAELVAQSDENEEQQALQVRRRLLDIIRIERRSITGPPIRPQRWFLEQIANDDHLDQKLAEVAVEQQKEVGDVRTLASRYAKEIVAHIDYDLVELGCRVLDSIFDSMYEKLIVDTEIIERIKKLSVSSPVIFVPNHRSHVDYLLLTYLFHRHHMTVPHIAAGKNLSFWPLGPLFRRGGAYFIRRTFRENRVYRAVLETYIRILLEQGYSQEFFIEGGRSRSGKLSPPRYGMLSMLTEQADLAGIDHLSFIPVAITYEQVVEQKSHIEELKGAKKRDERVIDLLKLTTFLKRQKHRYGNIHVCFAEPVAYTKAGEWNEAVIPKLAEQICQRINQHIVPTPSALIAMALLSTPARGVTKEDILSRAKSYLDFLKKSEIAVAESLQSNWEAAVNKGLAQFAERRLIISHHDHAPAFYEIPEDRRLALDYIKNGALHFFVEVSLKAAVSRGEGTEEDLSTLMHLFADEFHIDLEGSSSRRWDEKWSEAAKTDLEVFTHITSNYLEATLIACRLRAKDSSEEIQRSLLRAQQVGKRLLLLGRIRYPESLSRETLRAGLRMATKKRENLQNLQALLEKLL